RGLRDLVAGARWDDRENWHGPTLGALADRRHGGAVVRGWAACFPSAIGLSLREGGNGGGNVPLAPPSLMRAVLTALAGLRQLRRFCADGRS
ncbi:hypothetical protein ABTM58_19700, partial [Acinetobacter baumannii]